MHLILKNPSPSININKYEIIRLYQKENLGKPIYKIEATLNKKDLKKLSLKYNKQIKLIIKKLKKWTKQNIPEQKNKWDILGESNTIENFCASTSLEENFKDTLETIYLLFTNKNLALPIKEKQLKLIEEESFQVCAPGILTHLNSLVRGLSLTDDFYINLEQTIEELTKKYIFDFKQDLMALINTSEIERYIREMREDTRENISRQSARESIFALHELHFYNAFYNSIAKKYFLKQIHDPFISNRIPLVLFEKYDLFIEQNVAICMVDNLTDQRLEKISNLAMMEKPVAPLNEILSSWFADEVHSITNNIFNFNSISGSYLIKDYFLLWQILYYYNLISLQHQNKLTFNLIKSQQTLNFVAENQSVKQTIILVCKNTPLFLGYYCLEDKTIYFNPVNYINQFSSEFVSELIADPLFFKFLEGKLKHNQKKIFINDLILVLLRHNTILKTLNLMTSIFSKEQYELIFNNLNLKNFVKNYCSNLASFINFIIAVPRSEEFLFNKKQALLLSFSIIEQFVEESIAYLKFLNTQKDQDLKFLILMKYAISYNIVHVFFQVSTKTLIRALNLSMNTFLHLLPFIPPKLKFEFIKTFIVQNEKQLNSLTLNMLGEILKVLKPYNMSVNLIMEKELLSHLKTTVFPIKNLIHLTQFICVMNIYELKKFYFYFLENNTLEKLIFSFEEFLFLLKFLVPEKRYKVIQNATGKLLNIVNNIGDLIILLSYQAIENRWLFIHSKLFMETIQKNKFEATQIIELLKQLPENQRLFFLNEQVIQVCIFSHLIIPPQTLIKMLSFISLPEHQTMLALPFFELSLNAKIWSIDDFLNAMESMNYETASHFFFKPSVSSQLNQKTLNQIQFNRLLHVLFPTSKKYELEILNINANNPLLEYKLNFNGNQLIEKRKNVSQILLPVKFFKPNISNDAISANLVNAIDFTI